MLSLLSFWRWSSTSLQDEKNEDSDHQAIGRLATRGVPAVLEEEGAQKTLTVSIEALLTIRPVTSETEMTKKILSINLDNVVEAEEGIQGRRERDQ